MLMNANYRALLQELELPQVLLDCMEGRISHPIAGVHMAIGSGVFPPALIPIWREGKTYYGYWRHWFSPRIGTYVQMRMGMREVEEIARTSEQFFAWHLISAICCQEGIREETRAFADRVGITNLDELDAVTLDTGDEPSGFRAAAQFQKNVPLSCVSDLREYDGDFPTSAHIEREHLSESCLFEWGEAERLRIAESASCPPWLLPGGRDLLFDAELRKGNFSGAWMTLNSSGWEASAAKRAILQLNSLAPAGNFSLLARGWVDELGDRGGAY